MRALVIGGSGSIGQAIVQRLLAEGYEIIVHYNSADYDRLAELYENQPVQFVQADLMKDVDINAVFGFIQNLDCLIYTSGTSLYGMLQDMTDDDIDNSYMLHVKMLLRLSRYFVDQLRQSAHGRIVVVSSIWGEAGASFETVYSTMKSAQLGFVKALSRELAMTSVTVNAIAPGFVNGHMARDFDDQTLAEIIEGLPQQRLVEPEEVAHTCAYLCHPLAQSVTGTVQKVNGGWYIS